MTTRGIDRGETPSTRVINTTAPLTGGGDLSADLTLAVAAGGIGPTELASTAVTAGSYTSANITVDADGRLTAASNITAASIGPTQLATTAVVAGSYVNVNATVDAQGRITAMTSSVASGSPDGSVTGIAGQRVTDSATGVMWQNTNGATAWDPVAIPRAAGIANWTDLDDQVPGSLTAIGAGSATVSAEASRSGLRTYSFSVAGVDGGAVGTSTNRSVLLGNGVTKIRAGARNATLSDGTNNLIVRVGSHGITSVADCIHGAYYEYDFATYGDHNWRLCTSNNSTRTKTDTGILNVASSTTCQQFSITINAAGTSVTGSISGVTVATPVTTNIPTAASRMISGYSWLAYKQLGAGALTATIDWMDYYWLFTSLRSTP